MTRKQASRRLEARRAHQVCSAILRTSSISTLPTGFSSSMNWLKSSSKRSCFSLGRTWKRPVRPCRVRFCDTFSFPAALVGPVLFFAFSRLAASWPLRQFLPQHTWTPGAGANLRACAPDGRVERRGSATSGDARVGEARNGFGLSGLGVKRIVEEIVNGCRRGQRVILSRVRFSADIGCGSQEAFDDREFLR